MEYLPQITELAINVYFYLILIKFLLDFAGSSPHDNKFTYYVNHFTQPYLSFVTSKCRGLLHIYATLIALMILIWAEYFFPDLIRFMLGPAVEGASTVSIILLIFLSSLFAVLRSVLFFFGILSLIYFILLISKSPLNNPVTVSIMMMVEPLLSPLRRLFPSQKTDISPLILCIAIFAILYMVMPALSHLILRY